MIMVFIIFNISQIQYVSKLKIICLYFITYKVYLCILYISFIYIYIYVTYVETYILTFTKGQDYV